MKRETIHDKFRCLSNSISKWSGSVWAFAFATVLILLWLTVGVYFEWSEAHSLFINTVTTILTFLMVFVIQNTQNRNDKAMQLKLDEIIRSLRKARNSFVNLEELSDEEIRKVEKNIKHLAMNRPSAPRKGHSYSKKQGPTTKESV